MSDHESILANLPDDWTEATIEDLGAVVSGGTPSREIASFWGGTIPWVTPGEVTTLKRKTLRLTNESITDEGLRQSGANLLPIGSLLITTRASLGYCVINSVPVTTNQGFKSIVFRQSSNPDFYYHWARKVSTELKRRASGTTFLEISGSDFKQIKLPVPPSAEQQKIAQILDTLDTQIQKIEALIAKLDKIKEGLLRDLLTRGIDQNGLLRPTPEQAPEFYKESALGLIPMEWEAMRLKSVTRIAHGYAFSGSAFTDKPTGPVLLTPGNFHRNGGLYFTERNTKWYSGKVPVGYTLSPGDIVTVMTDLSPQTLILGMTTVVQKGHELLHNQRIGKIVLSNPKRWCSMFLSAQMSSFKFRSRVIAKATGTTVRHTSPEKILSEYVLVPGIEEQTETSRIIATHEQRISEEKNVAKKLLAHKHGLMNDLLTGRVRVTPLLKDAV